jgi:hypothetical protein
VRDEPIGIQAAVGKYRCRAGQPLARGVQAHPVLGSVEKAV